MSAMNPSARMTFTAQSIEPLYLTASPDVIIMRRRIVSIGYEIRPDVIVTTSHRQNAKKSLEKIVYEIPIDNIRNKFVTAD